jgi:hypothetical protein
MVRQILSGGIGSLELASSGHTTSEDYGRLQYRLENGPYVCSNCLAGTQLVEVQHVLHTFLTW